jgi:hypothetical protein
VILLPIHGNWPTKYYKNSYCLIFYRKTLTSNKYTINKEDKIIRKKYILINTKRVIWGDQRLKVEAPGLHGFYTLRLGYFSEKFSRASSIRMLLRGLLFSRSDFKEQYFLGDKTMFSLLEIPTYSGTHFPQCSVYRRRIKIKTGFTLARL